MATTMFFEEVLKDKGGKGQPIKLEVGRSSYYGDNLLYVVVDGKSVILDRKTGAALCEAFAGVAAYLGYDQ